MSEVDAISPDLFGPKMTFRNYKLETTYELHGRNYSLRTTYELQVRNYKWTTDLELQVNCKFGAKFELQVRNYKLRTTNEEYNHPVFNSSQGTNLNEQNCKTIFTQQMISCNVTWPDNLRIHNMMNLKQVNEYTVRYFPCLKNIMCSCKAPSGLEWHYAIRKLWQFTICGIEMKTRKVFFLFGVNM